MNPKIALRYVLIPAYILAVVTAIRTPLQITAPDHPVTPWVTSVGFMFLMFFLWPILLRREGLRYMEFLKVHLAMIFLVRLPVAAAYGMAFAFGWTEPSGEPVRYIRDFGPEFGPAAATLVAQFVPMVIGTVVSTVIWTIAWAITYRTEQDWSGASRTA